MIIFNCHMHHLLCLKWRHIIQITFYLSTLWWIHMKKIVLKENLIWEYFCVYQAVFITISFMNPIIFKSIQMRLVKVKVTQLCLTLCDPMDCTIHGILQARILECVAVPFSRELPNPRIELRSPTLQADSLPAEPQGKPWATRGFLWIFRWRMEWL